MNQVMKKNLKKCSKNVKKQQKKHYAWNVKVQKDQI